MSEIKIPSSVTKIENRAFYQCDRLKAILVPSSVQSIGNFAFYGCISLIQIEIPSSVQLIGECILHGCTRLEKIQIIPSPNERISFIDDQLLIYKSTVTGNYDTVIWVKNSIKSVNLSVLSSMASIGDHVFDHCSSLK